MPNKIVVVCGPTASGKTALGVELALLAGGEVVSLRQSEREGKRPVYQLL